MSHTPYRPLYAVRAGAEPRGFHVLGRPSNAALGAGDPPSAPSGMPPFVLPSMPSQDWSTIFKERTCSFTTPGQAFAVVLASFLAGPALRLVPGMQNVLAQPMWATIIIIPLGVWALFALPILLEAFRDSATRLLMSRFRRIVRLDDLALLEPSVRKASRGSTTAAGALLAYGVFLATFEFVLRAWLGDAFPGTLVQAAALACIGGIMASAWIRIRDARDTARALAADRRRTRR